MSSIQFVRHAQASLFSDDYDQLSEQGVRQSKLLGTYFQQQQIRFDKVFVGPRLRHRQTAEAAIPAIRDNPSLMVEVPELDEHQVDQLVAGHAAEIGKQFPRVAKFHADFCESESFEDRRRSFAILFEEVATLWVCGRCPLYGLESWRQFIKRVNAGIDRMIDLSGRRSNVIAFTSAGTVAASLHRALDCPDEVALGLGWRVWNCSLTGYAFSAQRFSLDQFNTVPHLIDRSDWTYR